MPELSPIGAVGWSAVAVLVAVWLWISLSRGERVRGAGSWIGATALYTALAALFTGLFSRAWEAGQTLLWIPFGFLLGVFIAGSLVSLVRTLGALRSGRAGSHATH